MSLTLLSEKDMPLLNRKRYTFQWDHLGKSTPTKTAVKEAVAAHLKIVPELIALRHVYTNYGSNTSKIIVHTYNDPATLKLLEPPKGKKAAAKAAAAPAKK